MTELVSFLMGVLQGALLLVAAPGITGLLRFLKAALQGRRRHIASIMQPYRDLLKYARKPAVRSDQTSWLFAATPYLLFAIYGSLAFVVPVFQLPTAARVDLIVVAYLLGLARFLFSLAGLDSGSPFGGLGTSREMFLSFLAEAGLFLVIAGLAILWHTVNLDTVIQKHWDQGFGIFLQDPALILLALAFAQILLFESGRIPIDNPDTHLELTMSRKAIELEFAGRDLALVQWAEMIKLASLMTLFAGICLPFFGRPASGYPLTWGWLAASSVALVAYAIKISLLATVLALWENSRPRMRLRAVGGPSLAAMALSLIAIIYIIALPGK